MLTADMEQLVALMESGAQWSDVGLPELYGSVTVGTTDPAKSNSGNMFAGLLANVLCGGSVERRTCRSCRPGSRPCSRSWGTWRAPPRTCSTSF
mgnify:CR=1 FL=1